MSDFHVWFDPIFATLCLAVGLFLFLWNQNWLVRARRLDTLRMERRRRDQMRALHPHSSKLTAKALKNMVAYGTLTRNK